MNTYRYLVTSNKEEPFLTNWFSEENHFNTDPEVGMIVYDLEQDMYLHWADREWKEIQHDSL
jgi:hypothetical protein